MGPGVFQGTTLMSCSATRSVQTITLWLRAVKRQIWHKYYWKLWVLQEYLAVHCKLIEQLMHKMKAHWSPLTTHWRANEHPLPAHWQLSPLHSHHYWPPMTSHWPPISIDWPPTEHSLTTTNPHWPFTDHSLPTIHWPPTDNHRLPLTSHWPLIDHQ